jgi:hypothetical protein
VFVRVLSRTNAAATAPQLKDVKKTSVNVIQNVNAAAKVANSALILVRPSAADVMVVRARDPSRNQRLFFLSSMQSRDKMPINLDVSAGNVLW